MFKTYTILTVILFLTGQQASSMSSLHRSSSTVVDIEPAYSSDFVKPLDEVKAKWLNWANTTVATEKDVFLKKYDLDASCLNDIELINMFKANSDQRGELEIAAISGQMPATVDLDVIKKISAEIFKGHNIEILDNPDFEIDDVGVFNHYQSSTDYIFLNCEKHLANIAQLEEVLRHEASHVIHEDNISEELMQYAAWTNSNVERAEIETQTLPYHKAFETRADVYAAINSPYHGKYLIDLFKKDYSKKGEEISGYVKNADRIALLEQIKFELDLAETK